MNTFSVLALFVMGTLPQISEASYLAPVSPRDAESADGQKSDAVSLFKTGVSAASDINAALFKPFCDSAPYQSAYTLCSTVSPPTACPTSTSPEAAKFCVDSVSTASSGTLSYPAGTSPTGKFCAYAISAPGKSILLSCTAVSFAGSSNPVRYTEMANGVNKLLTPNAQVVAQNSILIFTLKNSDLKQLTCSWKSA